MVKICYLFLIFLLSSCGPKIALYSKQGKGFLPPIVTGISFQNNKILLSGVRFNLVGSVSLVTGQNTSVLEFENLNSNEMLLSVANAVYLSTETNYTLNLKSGETTISYSFLLRIDPSVLASNISDDSITSNLLGDKSVGLNKLSISGAVDEDIYKFNSSLHDGFGGWELGPYVPIDSSAPISSIYMGTGLLGGTLDTGGVVAMDVGSSAGQILQYDSSSDLTVGRNLNLMDSGNIYFNEYSVFNDGNLKIYDESSSALRFTLDNVGDIFVPLNVTIGGKNVCLTDGTNCLPILPGTITSVDVGGGLAVTTITSTGDIYITTSGVTTDKIAAAAVTLSKIEDVSGSYFLVGSGPSAPTAIQIGGDATMSDSGNFQLNSDVITNSKILSKAVTISKMEDVTSAYFLIGNGANRLTAVETTGDGILDNSGVFSFSDGAIINDDINTNAAIDAFALAGGLVSNDEFYTLANVSDNIQNQFDDLTSIPPSFVRHDYTGNYAGTTSVSQQDTSGDDGTFYHRLAFWHMAGVIWGGSTENSRMMLTKFIDRNNTATVSDDTYTRITVSFRHDYSFSTAYAWGSKVSGWTIYDLQSIFNAVDIPNANIVSIVGSLRQVDVSLDNIFGAGRLSETFLRVVPVNGRRTRVLVITGFGAPNLFLQQPSKMEINGFAVIDTTDAVQ